MGGAAGIQLLLGMTRIKFVAVLICTTLNDLFVAQRQSYLGKAQRLLG